MNRIIEMSTAKRFNNKVQGRAAHPGADVGTMREPQRGSTKPSSTTSVVQPRWGYRAVLDCVPGGATRSRAGMLNAFGVNHWRFLAFLPLAILACFSSSCFAQSPRKPRIDDTIKANIYADNSFKLYINGELVAVDSIAFVPHNVVSVDVLPAYPMTIAAMGIDNADRETGMEYANTSIGDGGFILKFSDGTVTNATWKAKKLSWGPIDGDMKNPRVENIPVPKDWFAIDFDDSKWPHAKEFTEEEIGPKGPFFEHDFKGAKFIWSDDVKLDNLVLFRTVVKSPPDGIQRPDFRGLTDVVPQGGGRRGGGGRQGGRGRQGGGRRDGGEAGGAAK